jgi:L-asparagine oxygenase
MPSVMVAAHSAHTAPVVVQVPPFTLPTPTAPIDDEALVAAAGRAGRLLPAAAYEALVAFADKPHRSGAMLLRGVPIGVLPPTPSSPTAPTGKDLRTEMVLLAAARVLGQPVGYLPEHGGDLVQQIVPTPTASDRQVSTSSKVELMFHTEAAFHPHRPRYLLLLCLRGDSEARTTLASIGELLPHLPPHVVGTLFEPRFRTAVDESYLHGRRNVLGPCMPVLSGPTDAPTLVFDADLMVGVDADADDALRALSSAIAEHHVAVALEAGDLLVVDNTVAVHGRSPFRPRFDGTDRWLQRAFVVSDLAPSAADRHGRTIVTRFGV